MKNILFVSALFGILLVCSSYRLYYGNSFRSTSIKGFDLINRNLYGYLKYKSKNKGSSGDEVSGFRGLKGPDTTPILDSVQFPSDMKRLDLKQLKTLAHELRYCRKCCYCPACRNISFI